MVSQYQTCECDAFTRSTELKEGFHCYGAVSFGTWEVQESSVCGGKFIAVGAEVYALFALQCK